MSSTPGAREVGARDEARSTDVRDVLPGGDEKLADHSGENAFGVSGNVWRSVNAVDGIDSPLELCAGVGTEPVSSERRPSGRGGGGPVARWLAICSGKLSSRSGESTGVSDVDDEPKRADVGVGFGTLDIVDGWGDAGTRTEVGRSPMGSSTAGRDGCIGMPLRGTPVSEIVRATASRPLATANAPDERIVPGIAALGARVFALRAPSFVLFEPAGSVAPRVWPDPSPVPSDDELALPSVFTLRCGAREFASERVDADAFDAFDPPWPRITGVFGNDGAGDDASEMGEMGGMLIPCSRRSRPVLLGRLS